jgi:hypothetical protein
MGFARSGTRGREGGGGLNKNVEKPIVWAWVMTCGPAPASLEVGPNLRFLPGLENSTQKFLWSEKICKTIHPSPWGGGRDSTSFELGWRYSLYEHCSFRRDQQLCSSKFFHLKSSS